MSRTSPTVTAPAGRLLGAATALLLAVGCAGCSGGGGSGDPASPGPGAGTASGSAPADLGSSPPVEGGPGQPSAQRSSPGGNGGGFNAAGQVSPNVTGSWPSVTVKVTNTSGSGTLAVTVSQVTDCTGGKVTATAAPASTSEPVPPGEPKLFSFSFKLGSEPAGSGDRQICAKVSVGGSSISATGPIKGTASSSGGGSTPPASRASGGPSASYSAAAGASGGSSATAASTP